MVNTNYAPGRQAEYWARNELRDIGYLVLRMAGSKGPVDLVAIGPQNVMLVQVKRIQSGEVPSFDRELAELREIAKPAGVFCELWAWHDEHKCWFTFPA